MISNLDHTILRSKFLPQSQLPNSYKVWGTVLFCFWVSTLLILGLNLGCRVGKQLLQKVLDGLQIPPTTSYLLFLYNPAYFLRFVVLSATESFYRYKEAWLAEGHCWDLTWKP